MACTWISLKAQEVTIDKSNFFYQISPFYNFKQSIVSLTFDDGSANQFKIGIPVLKERNLPATFYVITDFIDSVSKSILLENFSKNLEIGSHTLTHPDLTKIGKANAEKELRNSQSYLQREFGINAGLTFCYPWGIFNNSVKQLVKSLYIAARSTDVGYNSIKILDRFALKMQNFDKSVNVSTANKRVDYAIKNHLWLIEMIHGINNIGYAPLDSAALVEHLDYIKTVESKIWCSTVSGVIKYIDESENTTVKCDFCDDTVYRIRINDFMDDSIYDQPLSVRIKVPNYWDNIWISNSEIVNTEFINNSKFILFNALPDNKPITIRPKLITAPEKNSGTQLVFLSINPFIDDIHLALEAFEQSDIDIMLCDISGKVLIHRKENAVLGVINISFNTSKMGRGAYFLRVNSSHGEQIVKKLMKVN